MLCASNSSYSSARSSTRKEAEGTVLLPGFFYARKGESSEDGASVLGDVGSVTAELFAVPKVLHTYCSFRLWAGDVEGKMSGY